MEDETEQKARRRSKAQGLKRGKYMINQNVHVLTPLYQHVYSRLCLYILKILSSETKTEENYLIFLRDISKRNIHVTDIEHIFRNNNSFCMVQLRKHLPTEMKPRYLCQKNCIV